jgi:siroheme synthase-like protein
VSAYPIVLEGSRLTALVAGGGGVAVRKVRALRAAGATVRVVARAVSAELGELARSDTNVAITVGDYSSGSLRGAQIVIAATDDAATNAAIARDARAAGILVNVVDAPELGDFVTPAVHRAGDLTISVVAGGVPSAAARIRDELGRQFDDRYASAVSLLQTVRARLLRGRDAAGERERWAEANAALTGDDFCGAVERGEFTDRVSRWR